MTSLSATKSKKTCEVTLEEVACNLKLASGKSDVFVTMLGNFSIRQKSTKEELALLSKLSGKSRRLWILVAYLIINRNKGVSASELINILWPDENAANPQTRLQNNISRARAMLEEGAFDNPRELIRFENGLYWWAPDRETVLDIDVFEQAAHGVDHIPDEEVEDALAICDLYQGDFLSQAADETWCTNLNIYYRSLFISYASKVLASLKRADRNADIKRLCLKVIDIEPTIEEFNIALMEALIAEGCPSKAIEHYEHIKTIFHDFYGVQVSPEIEVQRNLALEAMYGRNISKTALIEYFVDVNQDDGAFLCNTVTFREIVQLHARMLKRSGEPSQLVAVEFQAVRPGSASAEKNIANAKRLEKVIQKTLRAGDPFTKMGRNMFMILLPGANEENAAMVTGRILDNFKKEFPFVKVAFNTWQTPVEEIPSQQD